MVRRGCGDSRTAGGIYLEVATSPMGRPIDEFLVDPPHALTPQEIGALGITPIGVSVLQASSDVVHVVDWIGSVHYPNVADWIEEARRYGISRRIPASFDFGILSPTSRLITIHACAWIANWVEYTTGRMCPPKGEGGTRHDDPRRAPRMGPSLVGTRRDFLDWGPSEECCVALYWGDVRGGEPIPGDRPRSVKRTLADTTYQALEAPPGVDGRYCPAIFGSFPVGHLAVVRAPDGAHREALEKASRANLPVREVDE